MNSDSANDAKTTYSYFPQTDLPFGIFNFLVFVHDGSAECLFHGIGKDSEVVGNAIEDVSKRLCDRLPKFLHVDNPFVERPLLGNGPGVLSIGSIPGTWPATEKLRSRSNEQLFCHLCRVLKHAAMVGNWCIRRRS